MGRYDEVVRFYEGGDPDGFAAEIRAEFGFDPSEDERWGETVHVFSSHDERWGETPREFTSYAFVCPPEHLEAIYGSERFSVGS